LAKPFDLTSTFKLLFLFLTGANKSNIFDICLFPILLTKPQKIIGKTFHLNDASLKLGMAFNTGRNKRFMSRYDKKEQHSDVE
jgi:hypothetical protein